jgi:hypothetical protein
VASLGGTCVLAACRLKQSFFGFLDLRAADDRIA